MRVVDCNVGDRVLDSYPYSLAGTVPSDLERNGEVFAGYLGAVSPQRLKVVLGTGMGFIPVTFAGEYVDGAADELAQLALLGIPSGATVFLDLEGKKAFATAPSLLMSQIEGWGRSIVGAGYVAGLYVGVPQPLSSKELFKINSITRYWRGQGSIRDRFNALSEPDCGWCMTQMFPSRVVGTTLVDFNMVGQDYRGRVPTKVVL